MNEELGILGGLERSPSSEVDTKEKIRQLELELGLINSNGEDITEAGLKRKEDVKKAKAEKIQEIIDSKNLPTELPEKKIEQNIPQPTGTPAPQEPEMPQEKGIGSGIKTHIVQAFAGAADGIESMVNAGIGLVDYFDNKYFEDKYVPNNRLDVVGEAIPKTDAYYANITRGFSQFLAPYSGIAKAFKVSSTAGKAVSGIAADFLAFEGDEERLSNLIQSYPELANPITNYLAANKDDSDAEGRFKNAIEGIVLSGVAEGAFHAIKYIKNKRLAKEGIKTVEDVKSGKKIETKKTEPVVDTAGQKPVEQKPIENVGEPGQISVKPEDVPDNVVPIKPGVAQTKSVAGSIVEKDLLTKIDISPDELLKSVDTTGKGGGIQLNLERIDGDEQVLSLIKNFAEKDADALKKITANTSTEKQLELLASEVGLKTKDILSKRKGEAFNKEEMYAARMIHLAAGKELQKYAEEVMLTGSNEAMYKYTNALQAYRVINGIVTGAKSEASRVLNSLKQKVSGDYKDNSNVINEIISSVGERNIKKQAKAIAELELKDVAAVARKGWVKKSNDAFFEVLINKLLSNPKTHVINFTSNAGTFYYKQFERQVQAWTGSGIKELDGDLFKKAVETQRALTKMDTSRMTIFEAEEVAQKLKEANEIIRENMAYNYTKGEAYAAVSGGTKEMANQTLAFFSSMYDGIRTIYKSKDSQALKDFLSSPEKDMFTKTESFQPAITSDNFGGSVATDFYGAAIRVPTKLLNMADNFWKSVNYKAEVHALAQRAGSLSGLSGDELRAFVNDFINDPPDYIDMMAKKEARINTFTNSLSGDVVESLQTVQQIDVGGITPLRAVVPFVRTPLNIAKFGMERTPLAPFVQDWRDAFNAGGGARREAMVKMGLGSTITGILGIAAYNGYVTGGPSKNYKTERALEGLKEPNYSFKIGDSYFPFDKFPVPFNTYLKIAADANDMYLAAQTEDQKREVSEFMNLAIFTMINHIGVDQVLDGFGNIFEAIEKEDVGLLTKGPIANFASGLVPSLMLAGPLRQGADELRRSTKAGKEDPSPYLQEIANQIKNNIPGLSSTLPPIRNIFGEEMEIPRGLGLEAVNPFHVKKFNSKDPLTKELAILGYLGPFKSASPDEGEKHLNFALPQNYFSIENNIINLNPQQYDRYVVLSAGIGLESAEKTLKEQLTHLVKNNYDGQLSAGTKQEKRIAIGNIISKYRLAAKEQLLREFPELISNLEVKAKKRHKAITGEDVP